MAFFLLAYPQIFLLPAIPPVPAGDEVLWLVDGQRINHGQVLYRDFYEVTFPGVQYVYAALDRVAGAHAFVPALTYLVLGAMTALVLVSIARRILPNRLPWLAAGLYLVGPFFVIPDATHHWFAALFIYGAIWIALRYTGYAASGAVGACCAAAALFMQVKGVFALAAFLMFEIARALYRRSWRRAIGQIAVTCASFAVMLAVLLAPSIRDAGFDTVAYNTIGFVVSDWGAHFADTWRVYMSFPPAHSRLLDVPGVVAFLLVYGAVPLVYVLVLYRVLRGQAPATRDAREALALLWLVGVAMFLAVVKAPSTIRIASGSAPAFVLLVWLLDVPGRFERIALRAAWIATALLVIACPLARQFAWHATLKTRVGTVAFRDPSWYHTASALLPLLPAGQPCFGNHVACYLAGDVVVGPVNFITPGGYTNERQVRQLIDSLEMRAVPNLVLRAIFYLPDPLAGNDPLRPFRAYLYAHYRFVKILPNADELWVRMPAAVSASN